MRVWLRNFTGRFWSTLGFIGLLIVFFWHSRQLSESAAAISTTVIALSLALLVFQLLRECIGIRGATAITIETESEEKASPRGIALVRIFAWLGAIPLLFGLFGISAGAALYCMAYLRWHAAETWLFSLVYALIIGTLVKLIFDMLLPVNYYQGMFYSLIA